ncbi:MAG TPA: hypothetical protein VLA21_05350 [Candidatus Limnocylindria bacterium]|nr:hypothetical protein [Candidatus Limnocylindria bacterium]
MRKILSVSLALVLVLGLAAAALADTKTAQSVVITVPDTVYVNEPFQVTAKTLKEGNSLDHSTWNLGNFLADGGALVAGSLTLNAIAPVDGYYNHNLSLTAPANPGTYTFLYTIRMYNNSNEWLGSAEDVLVVLPIQLVVDHPAAPAIAARLLKEAGLKPNYGKNLNYVSAVAAKMGPGTEFCGVAKDQPAAYEAAVLAFLKGLGAGL